MHQSHVCMAFVCADLALKVLEHDGNQYLAFERDSPNLETVLHILARKPINSNCQSQSQRLMRPGK